MDSKRVSEFEALIDKMEHFSGHSVVFMGYELRIADLRDLLASHRALSAALAQAEAEREALRRAVEALGCDCDDEVGYRCIGCAILAHALPTPAPPSPEHRSGPPVREGRIVDTSTTAPRLRDVGKTARSLSWWPSQGLPGLETVTSDERRQPPRRPRPGRGVP